MGSKAAWKKALTPLMEGPFQEEGGKKESSWELIREWFRVQKGIQGSNMSSSFPPKTQELRLLLGVLGCPLAPIPIAADDMLPFLYNLKDIPFETSTAHYIVQQYLAATGCLKQHASHKNMYATGSVKMICCETEVSTGRSVKTLGGRSGETGCFVVWQMMPGMWSLELVVGANKVVAGSDGKIVWRHTPWLGAHAAKGPQRPLRRIIQGLDPKGTARLFSKAQCLGEKRVGDEDCFVLKATADRAAVMERSEARAEVVRHALYGYFSQKSGLLVYLEDSHLTRVDSDSSPDSAVYWETTIGSTLADHRPVDGTAGLVVAHAGRSVATVFRCAEASGVAHTRYTRTRMEELWAIDDVAFDVPGLSADSFLPPADLLHPSH